MVIQAFFSAFEAKLKRGKTQFFPKLKPKMAKTQAKFSKNSDSRVPNTRNCLVEQQTKGF